MNKGVRLLAGADRGEVPSPAGRRVRELIRAAPLLCPPSTSVQDAARQMIDAGVCAVVDLGASSASSPTATSGLASWPPPHHRRKPR